jgi:hypothetical protein
MGPTAKSLKVCEAREGELLVIVSRVRPAYVGCLGCSHSGAMISCRVLPPASPRSPRRAALSMLCHVSPGSPGITPGVCAKGKSFVCCMNA